MGFFSFYTVNDTTGIETAFNVNDTASSVVCKFNGFFSDQLIFMFLLAFFIVLTASLFLLNPPVLSVFLSSLISTFIGILIFFIRIDGCNAMISMKQLSFFISMLVISGLLIWFSDTQ